MTKCINFPFHDNKITVIDSIQHHVTFISIKDSDSRLLPRVHELITQHISDINDIDSLVAMRKYMRDAKTLSEHCLSYNIIAAINSRDDILGATIFGLFSTGALSFIKGEYTVIIPGARKNAMLEHLLKERYAVARNACISLGIQEPGFTVIQVCSVKGQPENSSLQRMWRLRGFRHIDFPFVQLPLRNDLNAVTSFDCLLQPLTEEFFNRTHLTAEEMLSIIDATCTFRESQKHFTEYKEYNYMKMYIEKMKSIPLCR